MKLILVRSCTSTWSEENKFMGWSDAPLSKSGIIEAGQIGQKLKTIVIDIGIAYSSDLTRAKDTLKYIKEEVGLDIKTRQTYKLNAQHCGVLEGMNKDEANYLYGAEHISKWQNIFEEKPPELSITDERFPGNDPKYSHILKFELPLSESPKDVYERVVHYFDHEISTFLKVGENVLVVAHESSLRMLCKHVEDIADEDIENLDTTGTIIYDLDDDLKVRSKEIVH